MKCVSVPLLVLLALLMDLCAACPTSCVCKWKNGKQTVECVEKGLLIIPDGMDSGTQVLEFNGNNLRTLHKEKFLKMELIHLQRIYLARCHILIIEDGTFKGLTNLVELDLSANALEFVPSGAFLDCPSLMRLTLSANPIRLLKREAFGHLSFLQTLELSDCQLGKVEPGAFDGLQSLERLRLNGNQLTTIGGGGGGGSALPKHLQEVDLQGNDWQCDCHMVEMHAWLEGYELPSDVAPLCAGPARLAKRLVKSIPRSELACLPDVSPTSFYLEIAEGKNISLQCQIRAAPEAHVAWWFQGQLLHNDTLLTPDTRLIYYVEESGGGAGGEDKRSELFIYNTNAEDNGTFICSAENPAGIVQSNFTIHILLKEEPAHELAQLPFEFVLIIASAIGVSLVVICFALILSIVKCHSERRRRKKEDARQNLVLSNSTKDSLLQGSTEEFSDLSKESSNPNLVQVQQQMLFYASTSEEILRSMSPILAANQLCTPASLNCYQLEQNPDLINDAESISIGKRHDGDGEDKHANIKYDEASNAVAVAAASSIVAGENFELSSKLLHQHAHIAHPAHPAYYLQQQPPPTSSSSPSSSTTGLASAAAPPEAAVTTEKRCNRDLYRLSADVHLNPVGLLNTATTAAAAANSRTHFANGNCYRTLPYNRGVKRQSSLQETTHRYHRDAEFMPPHTHTLGHHHQRQQPFEHYNTNVRYTADGYPVRTCCDSEAETQFSDTESVRSCCSAPAVPWPPHAATTTSAQSTPLVSILKNSTASTAPVVTTIETGRKNVVGAQTQTDITVLPLGINASSNKPLNRSVCSAVKIAETLTESPDEGYEGEESQTKV